MEEEQLLELETTPIEGTEAGAIGVMDEIDASMLDAILAEEEEEAQPRQMMEEEEVVVVDDDMEEEPVATAGGGDVAPPAESSPVVAASGENNREEDNEAQEEVKEEEQPGSPTTNKEDMEEEPGSPTTSKVDAEEDKQEDQQDKESKDDKEEEQPGSPTTSKVDADEEDKEEEQQEESKKDAKEEEQLPGSPTNKEEDMEEEEQQPGSPNSKEDKADMEDAEEDKEQQQPGSPATNKEEEQPRSPTPSKEEDAEDAPDQEDPAPPRSPTNSKVDEEEERSPQVEDDEEEPVPTTSSSSSSSAPTLTPQQAIKESERFYLACKEGGLDTLRTKIAQYGARYLRLTPRHVVTVLSTSKRSEHNKAAVLDVLYSHAELWQQMPDDFHVAHTCCEYDMPAVLHVLFRHKLDPLFELDDSGETVLHVLCRNDCARSLAWIASSESPAASAFAKASMVRNMAGELCFDLLPPSSARSQAAGTRALFRDALGDLLKPRLFGGAGAAALTGMVSNAACVSVAAEEEGEAGGQVVRDVASGRFRRACGIVKEEEESGAVLVQCEASFPGQVAVIDVFHQDENGRFAVTLKTTSSSISFELKPPAALRREDISSWQNDFYKAHTGRLAFRQLVTSQLAPALRACHVTGCVLVRVQCARAASSAFGLVPRDVQLLAAHVSKLSNMCCEGRFVSLLITGSGGEEEPYVKAYVDALCGEGEGGEAAFEYEQPQQAQTASAEFDFYVEDKSSQRRSKRQSQQQQQQQQLALQQQQQLQGGNLRKRKADDTAVWDFVKQIRLMDAGGAGGGGEAGSVPREFMRLVALYHQQQQKTDADATVAQIRDLLRHRRDLLDAFNALLTSV